MAIAKKNNIKIYIFTSEPFPHGLASTNRIISYARGFLFHHEKVEVICIRKTEKRGDFVNKNAIGSYRNIPFKYLASSTKKSDSFVMRQFDGLIMNFKLFFFSLVHLNANTFSIYYSPLTSPAIILRITSCLKNSRLFKEENEHPSIRIMNRPMLVRFFFSKVHYNLFDGLLLMTVHLINYFKETKHYKNPILHVPMTVDIERFQLTNVIPKKNIVYCGELDHKKDGIDILIKAFAIVTVHYPEYTLLLIGKANSDEDLASYNQLASELKIKEKIDFYGKASYDEIPILLSEASILVLPRPDSIQAQHGFPTKLGEYLATGNPVIASSVGEIPDYLTDGISAYLVEPGNIDSLVEKIMKLLNNTTASSRIGKNGKEIAIQYFNNIKQTRDILNFYNKLK
jgi:glycosyltransferase involved in cell wall biosynthesis